MTVNATPTQTTTPHPPGASLHLGGNAWASPDLEPLLVPITDTHPFPGNPRRHDQDGITASIRDHGLYQGVVLQQSTGWTMVGNGRRQALLDLGATRIPRTLLDVGEDRARAIVARDNRTSDLSTNEDELLLALLSPLADADLLHLAGYDDDEMDDLRRLLANAAFVDGALDGTATDPAAPLTEHTTPIDVDGDTIRVTVTVDAAHKADLYALLADKPWILDAADAHTRRPA